MSLHSTDNAHRVERFFQWMSETGRARIIRFTCSHTELYSALHDIEIDPYDANTIEASPGGIIHYLNYLINEYATVTDAEKQRFKTSFPREWVTDNPDLYTMYRLSKLLWLTRDIKMRGQTSPIQVILGSNGDYFCHPGSDKRISLTYLEPQERIHGYYVWFPELDDTPWPLSLSDHGFVDTPVEYISLFGDHDHATFKFETSVITFDDTGWSCDNPDGMLNIRNFAKTINNSEQREKLLNNSIAFISYVDALHRMGLHENTSIIDEIYFESQDKFCLGEYHFTRLDNGVWSKD